MRATVGAIIAPFLYLAAVALLLVAVTPPEAHPWIVWALGVWAAVTVLMLVAVAGSGRLNRRARPPRRPY